MHHGPKSRPPAIQTCAGRPVSVHGLICATLKTIVGHRWKKVWPMMLGVTGTPLYQRGDETLRAIQASPLNSHHTWKGYLKLSLVSSPARWRAVRGERFDQCEHPCTSLFLYSRSSHCPTCLFFLFTALALCSSTSSHPSIRHLTSTQNVEFRRKVPRHAPSYFRPWSPQS